MTKSDSHGTDVLAQNHTRTPQTSQACGTYLHLKPGEQVHLSGSRIFKCLPRKHCMACGLQERAQRVLAPPGRPSRVSRKFSRNDFSPGDLTDGLRGLRDCFVGGIAIHPGPMQPVRHWNLNPCRASDGAVASCYVSRAVLKVLAVHMILIVN
ncbi:hypothetical protein BGZ61DRAFT_217852 [Ilyonectria robusta]|uniref:uncharacterized protein n=1 Tax=Ilyonectria robusta TaxID=1079257 RepID=UPI001E8E1737|nr:uncharacterized protein BGZ61DRAFT_217852 [Ilyonectria robusta]KAH8706150.1 hypothetical protein BGZ61DRAFT_217852 [Ilyonectria robusta]